MKVRTQSLASTRRFFLGDLRTPITVNIWRDDETGWLSASASHAFKTPIPRNPDLPQPLGYDRRDAEDAFGSVVSEYEGEYLRATSAGEKLTDAWLVPNPVG